MDYADSQTLCAREQIHMMPIASIDFLMLVLNAFSYFSISMKQNPNFNSQLTACAVAGEHPAQ